ncbi:NAD(P)-dependent alcohol dehydrogenase [Rhizobium rhizosphaerae]|uniref:NAD(P)-dependent alcohol dehydrogenase n=1 Tax=Xaviernesmea rhizosphaerae TaxID=1672749 RepID=A0ABX3PEF9_9HYPH|nr:NAD(P)-dependent alcohol dehydrogenase [Xaviernesmea rhizosphaerae]OQP86595.1 NAD(P)-dependent alcohol dehydrogenase [Xaviernesmea rhizosphaerae]
MRSLVLERKNELRIRDLDPKETLGPTDVRIAIKTVGVCGSDVHYYTHGAIGPFVVREPMILGHEAAGVIEEVGSAVDTLKVGDRVCMEPGIPDANSRASRLGLYNLDPAVRFWATPPVHGVLRPSVVHPAAFTFKLPDNVSYAAGAMVEPLAVGFHAISKAKLTPGAIALVTGAGPIGMVTAIAALSAGCAKVIVTDIVDEKLDVARKLGPAIMTVNIRSQDLKSVIARETDGWGVDVVFECSGAAEVIADSLHHACPGGAIVLVGMPVKPVAFDVVIAQTKELRVEHVFRYAHVYPRIVALLGSNQISVDALITDTYAFEQSVEAFDYAVRPKPSSVKIQIELGR